MEDPNTQAKERISKLTATKIDQKWMLRPIASGPGKASDATGKRSHRDNASNPHSQKQQPPKRHKPKDTMNNVQDHIAAETGGHALNCGSQDRLANTLEPRTLSHTHLPIVSLVRSIQIAFWPVVPSRCLLHAGHDVSARHHSNAAVRTFISAIIAW